MQPRRLLLIRHAKAADGPVDVDRALTGRGRGQAAAIGTWLADAGFAPDRALVSPARRAAQTWEQAAAHLGAAPEHEVESRIYDNTVEALLAVIADAPDGVQTLAVVGHNPSIGGNWRTTSTTTRAARRPGATSTPASRRWRRRLHPGHAVQRARAGHRDADRLPDAAGLAALSRGPAAPPGVGRAAGRRPRRPRRRRPARR